MGTNILRCNIEVWEERLIIYISLRCFTQHLLLLEDSQLIWIKKNKCIIGFMNIFSN